MGKRKAEEDGFGHMVETAEPVAEEKDVISEDVNIPLEENILKVQRADRGS